MNNELNEIGIKRLTTTFDRHAVEVLAALGVLGKNVAGRGKPRRFQLLKPLPNEEAYLTAKAQHYEVSIQHLIAGAFTDIEEVKDELQNWHDGLPENLQDGTKASELEEAIDTLEGCSEPEWPKELEDFKVSHYPMLNIESRGDRVAEAAAMLETAKAELEALQKALEEDGEKESGNQNAEKIDAIEELVSELDNAIDEWQGVCIPGMY